MSCYKIVFLISLIVMIVVILQMSFKTPERLTELDDVYLLRCHQSDAATLSALDAMISDVGLENTYVLFDDDDGKRDPRYLRERVNDRLIVHNNAMCKRMNKYHGSQWQNFETPVVIAWRRIKKSGLPRHVWLIESDVCYTGNLSKTLNKGVSLSSTPDADFIATFVERYSENNSWWMWWRSLVGGIASLKLEDRVKSFFPVLRLTPRLLDALDASLGKSSGFCEVYVGSLAHSRGYSVGNLSTEILGMPFDHVDRGADNIKAIETLAARQHEAGLLLHKCIQ